MKNDRLMPVVTLVIYFGAKEWDGPLSLHEMFDETDSRILALVPDYKINLIAPALIPDEDFDKFKTSLREVLSFIKYSNNPDKMKKILDADDGFREMGHKEIDVLNACADAKLTIRKGEEVLDVCEAIQTLERRAAEKAAEKTEKETRISTLVGVVKNLMNAQNESVDQIMDKIGISDADRRELKQYL